MENRAINPPQTEMILNNIEIVGAPDDDIEVVLHMKDGLNLIIKHLMDPLTGEYICKFHGLIARNEALEWGYFAPIT